MKSPSDPPPRPDGTSPDRPAAQAAQRPSGGAKTREDRLKAALKANMAKRKAQTRARRSGEEADTDVNNNEKE